ncbi:MAG: hypothetical protein LBB36_03095 [Fibromonadaceae bacterium]|jgi:hypothetical protein|nr:hypothetical protein [Fibromonadaceae bacterium]
MNSNKQTYLKRYISLERLRNILNSNCLDFNDPESWDDDNDIASVKAFRWLKSKDMAKQIKVGAICFAKGSELVHHWNSYAKDGCCITFNEVELFKEIIHKPNFLCGYMNYKTNEELDEYLKKQGTDKIPFIKRKPYECEKEYRVIWFGTGKLPKLRFKRTAIGRVLLSSELKNREQIQEELKKKYRGIKIELSRLTGSEPWISKFDNLCNTVL